MVPDHWNAASTKPAGNEAAEPTLPKLVVVGGAGTYPGNNDPSLSALDEASLSSPVELSTEQSAESTPNKNGKGGLLDDIAEDLGVPYFKDWKKSVFKLL